MLNIKSKEVKVDGCPDPLTLVTDWPEKPDLELIHIGFEGPGYYFWDETQAHVQGPYETAEATLTARKEYSEWLNAEKEETENSEECKS